MAKRAPRYVGVLTAGGDTPGLNAALRAIGKAAEYREGMRVIGFRDGFKGPWRTATCRWAPTCSPAS
jgi:6-phosphofructokinase 1